MISKIPDAFRRKTPQKKTRHTLVSARLPRMSRSDDLQSLWSKPRLETGRKILSDDPQKKKKKKKKKIPMHRLPEGPKRISKILLLQSHIVHVNLYSFTFWETYFFSTFSSINSLWTKLVDLESPKLYTKIQPLSFLVSGEEDFKRFTIYSHGDNRAKWSRPVWINSLYPFDKRHDAKFYEICQAV